MSTTIPMQLSRIIISEISDNQVIYLKEIEGERQFPILIGIFEATSIDRRVKNGARPPRPLTHSRPSTWSTGQTLPVSTT